MCTSESVHRLLLTHNPCGEVRWASRMRENLTYGSYGEGLETDRRCWPAPRQSLTRQMMFKSMKQYFRLEQIPSKKVQIVEALLLSALITWLVSRQLMREVQRKLGPTGNRVKELRFAAIFAALSLDILAIVIQRPKYNRLRLRRVISTLLKESIDPNASRMDLVTNVENRTHHYCSRKTGVYGS